MTDSYFKSVLFLIYFGIYCFGVGRLWAIACPSNLFELLVASLVTATLIAIGCFGYYVQITNS